MLCSSCSAVVRPVVAVDIDGTMSDYHDSFLKLVEQYTGQDRPNVVYAGGPEGSWGQWIQETWGLQRSEYEAIKRAYRMGSWKRWQPIDAFCWTFLTTIAEKAEIWITTTRPFLNHDSIDPDTKFWLDQHMIPYDRILYDEDKYGVLRQQVDKRRVVAIVEDLPEQMERAIELFGDHVPIQKVSRWNYMAQVGYGLDNFDDIRVAVMSRVADWRYA